IPLFAPAKELRSVVMKIKTGSEGLDDPKQPEGATVFELYRCVASPAEAERMAERLRAGGYGWGHAKQDLYEALEAELGPKREVFQQLRADEAGLDRMLALGAERAREIASRTMGRV